MPLGDADAFAALAERGPICIEVDSTQADARSLPSWLSSLPGSETIQQQRAGEGRVLSGRSFFMLHRRSPAAGHP